MFGSNHYSANSFINPVRWRHMEILFFLKGDTVSISFIVAPSNGVVLCFKDFVT